MAKQARKSSTRNSVLANGVRNLSRSAAYKASGRWNKKMTKKTTAPAKQAEAPAAKKAGKWYPTGTVQTPLPSNKANKAAARIRDSCKPGNVVIMLAGKYRGKRAVVVGTTESGLLVVSGPFKINGVPLRRVNQAYVIGTSTTVDVSKVDASKFNDAYFAKAKSAGHKKSEKEFFEGSEKKKEIPAARKADQAAVDKAVLGGIKDGLLKKYLGSTFTLKNGQYPHEMIF